MCPPQIWLYVLGETLESWLLEALAADRQTRPQLNLLPYNKLESGVKVRLDMIGSILQLYHNSDLNKSNPIVL